MMEANQEDYIEVKPIKEDWDEDDFPDANSLLDELDRKFSSNLEID